MVKTKRLKKEQNKNYTFKFVDIIKHMCLKSYIQYFIKKYEILYYPMLIYYLRLIDLIIYCFIVPNNKISTTYCLF